MLVEVGAGDGASYEALRAARIPVREAHLIESDSEAFARMGRRLGRLRGGGGQVALHNLALGAPQDGLDSGADKAVTSLDALVESFEHKHISLLKIGAGNDVGQVLEGARELLRHEAIDLIHVDATLDPECANGCFYRDIEAALGEFGYSLCRIYENADAANEGRVPNVSIAFISDHFSSVNPLRIANQLHDARRQTSERDNELLALKERLEEIEQVRAKLEAENRDFDAILAERDALRGKLQRNDGETGERIAALEQGLAEARKAELAALKDLKSKQLETAKLIKDVERLEVEIASKATRISELTAEREAQAGDLKRLHESQKTLSREAEMLARDRNALVKYGQKLESRYQAVLQSTSWRMTGPLRSFVRKTKSIFTGKHSNPRRMPKMPKISQASEVHLQTTMRNQAERAASKSENRKGRAGTPAPRKQNPVPSSSTSQNVSNALSNLNSNAKEWLVDIARDNLPQPAQQAIRKIIDTKAVVLKPADDELLENPGRTARHIINLLKTSAMAEIEILRRKLESRMATEQGALLHDFLVVTLGKKISAFGFGAQAMDRLVMRYDDDRMRLVSLLGETAYHRLIGDGAISLTRVGRYEDARALLDREISAGAAALRPVRAEVSWIHDPEQAVLDLEQHGGSKGAAGLKRGDALLHAHLMSSVFDHPNQTSLLTEKGDEFLLVAANRALKERQLAEYRNLLNRYFEQQHLSSPFAVSNEEFSFDHLSSTNARSIASGPVVSVVMTSYNSSATIGYAIRSILGQTYSNIELLVVDDCSTDDTRDILARLASQDARVKVLHNERNLGTYGAKNRAIAVASGRYITCHDSDDWAHPQRIETHVNTMQANSNVVATRSNWLRIDSNGRVDFRRWHKRFSHPNPASTFFKSDVVNKIGFFDEVRFGADSEYWKRCTQMYGSSATMQMKQVLGLGFQSASSLTQDGAGAMGVEHYSSVRSSYLFSQNEWYANTSKEKLYIKGKREFWAPDAMLGKDLPSNGSVSSLAQLYPSGNGKVPPNFIFGLSLASRAASQKWDHTEHLLARTLRSVLNQSDPRFRVVICGHERPDIKELDDPRVIFITADIKPPANSSQFRRDKMWKRRLIGAALRNMGGGYFFPLDADDLVHTNLVAHVLSDDNRRGYNINHGYVEDFLNSKLAPVPGAWSVPFDRVCGSSAVLYFEPEDLPLDGRNDESLYFNLFQSHAYWPVVAEESGKPLATVPFPAAVYVVNHSQNLSFGLQRAGKRAKNIISFVDRDAVPDGQEILKKQFGQVLP